MENQMSKILTISVLLFAGFYVLYIAKYSVPDLTPTFLYESMSSYTEYHAGQLGHSFYETRRSANHEINAPKELFRRRHEEKIIILVIPGNLGGYIQIPPILNTIDNYTDFLNSQQTKTHYRTYSYGFEFGAQPSAFSDAILKDQASYVAKSINECMHQHDKKFKFTIITHSMGTLVAYLATQSKIFPLQRLANIISLSGPLEESPQLFNQDISKYLNKIITNSSDYLRNEVLHINFHGGPRDQMVDQNLASYQRFQLQNATFKYSLAIKTTSLKNVYQPMDHNSLLYYKHFYDMAGPIMAKVASKGFLDIQQRHQMVVDSITFHTDYLNLTNNKQVDQWEIGDQKIIKIPNVKEPVQVEINQENEVYEIEIEKYDQLIKNLNAKIGENNTVKANYYIDLQTNIDRTQKLSVFIRTTNNSLIDVTIDDFLHRVYHKSNLYLLKISLQSLQDLLTPSKMKFKSLIIKFDHQNSEEVMFNIMNYSPCYDKNTPVIWKEKQEGMKYLQVTLDSEGVTHTVEQSHFYFKMKTLLLTDKGSQKLLIKHEVTEGIQVTGTPMPLQVCVKYNEQTQVNNIISIKFEHDVNPEMFFVNSTQPCFNTYPMRHKYIGFHNVEINIYGDYSQLRGAKLVIQPLYSQLFRESVIHHKWYLINITIAVAIFLHLIQTENLNYSVLRLYFQQYVYVLGLILSINIVNMAYYKELNYIGDMVDTRLDTSYYYNADQISFKLSFIDSIVATVVVYTLLFAIFVAFELLNIIARFLFKDKFFRNNHTICKVIETLLIILIFVSAYSSFYYNLYFAALAVVLAVMIKMIMHSNRVKGNIQAEYLTSVFLPLILYMCLFIDKYMIEIWRLSHGMKYFDYHYESNDKQKHHMYVMIYAIALMIFGPQIVTHHYSKFKYPLLILSLYAMFFVGQFLHRIRIFQYGWIAMIFILLICETIDLIKGKGPVKTDDEVEKKKLKEE